ncbi:hypothetical protein [Corynebacterium lubricantis]|uniref:hypothetical protein n=1 Tax=Corynebacterium lubricantis TaxID=541095 RepID=UPI0003712C66|nr:hypothetical protein [Corynebacterium lubricantis]
MGLLDRIRTFLGTEKYPELVDYPDEVAITEVDVLNVHTAHITPDTKDIIVIVTLDERAFQLVRGTEEPLRMTLRDERPVTWVPVEQDGPPALDPTLGWIIPLTPETQAELRALPADTDQVELETINVGLIVEKRVL